MSGHLHALPHRLYVDRNDSEPNGRGHQLVARSEFCRVSSRSTMSRQINGPNWYGCLAEWMGWLTSENFPA